MTNIHATLISIAGNGILIAGPSGSGKSLLALHLYRRCHLAGIDAAIVSDDQVLLKIDGGVLFGTPPTSIAGQIEVRGYGPVHHNGKATETKIALHVLLVPIEDATRFWDGETTHIEGQAIQSLKLPRAHIENAANAVLAALGYPLTV